MGYDQGAEKNAIMTEAIRSVQRCKFIEKDLPSSGAMIEEIDGLDV